MTRAEFERELEQYLAQRRRAKLKVPNIFGWFKQKKKMPEPELPPEIQKYDEQTPAEQPEPTETLQVEEQPAETQPAEAKKGVLTKILEGVGLVTVEEKKSEEIPQEEVQKLLEKDDITQDTREIAKIALSVIKKLPPEQLAEYKQSQEFLRLKELLKKHQLIK